MSLFFLLQLFHGNYIFFTGEILIPLTNKFLLRAIGINNLKSVFIGLLQ
jgi:hypothetical protein